MPVHREPPDPMTRQRITVPLSTGVRAIDGMLTMGRGQRMGIFAGSGVGKSTLMGMIARDSAADINVIALVGERGREVRDFIERDLGPEGMARSVVIAATSDQPALIRRQGALVADYISQAGMACPVRRPDRRQRGCGRAAPRVRGGDPPAEATGGQDETGSAA